MKDFFDTWKFKILVAVAVFLVGIMAYAGANGRLTAAPQELLGVILTPFQKAAAVVSRRCFSILVKLNIASENFDNCLIIRLWNTKFSTKTVMDAIIGIRFHKIKVIFVFIFKYPSTFFVNTSNHAVIK